MDIAYDYRKPIDCKTFFEEVGFEHLSTLQQIEDQARLKTRLSVASQEFIVKASFHEPGTGNQEVRLQDSMDKFVNAFNKEFADSFFRLQLQPIVYAVTLPPETVSSFLPALVDTYTNGKELVISYALLIQDRVQYKDLSEDQRNNVLGHLKTFRQSARSQGLIPIDFDAGQLLYQVGEDGAITAHIVDYEEWEELSI